MKIIEENIGDSLVKVIAEATIDYHTDKSSIVIFNEGSDVWDVGIQKYTGVEHVIENPRAVGLIFNKSSAATIIKLLRYMADKLEGKEDEPESKT